MGTIDYGQRVCVYNERGKYVGKGTVVGRNTHNWTDPQHVTVMPDGKESLKDAWKSWPISLVRRYSPPTESEEPQHILDYA